VQRDTVVNPNDDDDRGLSLVVATKHHPAGREIRYYK
jgi:hypothetical protein